ncbi:MAG: hypothetical protein ACXITV_01450 [Luteibaculaceae bacterium]
MGTFIQRFYMEENERIVKLSVARRNFWLTLNLCLFTFIMLGYTVQERSGIPLVLVVILCLGAVGLLLKLTKDILTLKRKDETFM